jgi:DNA (cytosine-5)-methyltransferase 3A
MVLTLKEACRLQTVPDDYLDVDIPLNEKYKCLGNGWTVDVIVHILKAIDK